MHTIDEEMFANPSPVTSKEVAFGSFRLSVAERRLQHDGKPVQIGSRALDILMVLVKSVGEVVEKRELLAKVWPGIVVEESSLRAHVAGLRKVLGDGIGDARYIANIPGRGYCFVAPVVCALTVPQHKSQDISPDASMPLGNVISIAPLPPTLTRMIGRDATVQMLATRLERQRFMSLVGPGGIGKTTTAISLAHHVTHRTNQRAVFVDLGSIEDKNLVLATIASRLGLRLDRGDFSLSIVAALIESPALLILDNCEHVIDVIAAICERIFVEATSTAIVVTSREALRVEGEIVFRLPPLELPPEDIKFSAADTASYSAVQMFLERAEAAGLETALDAEMPMIARLCRQLDGLPLAIELAAARACSFGIPALTKLLDQQFGLYWQGRRTAHPRHQTMHSVLDWSYRLLSDYECDVLQQLSIFKGIFSFADALAVSLNSNGQEGDMIDALDALVAKSLLSPHRDHQQIHYRLLDSTRAYAAHRLAQSGRLSVTCRRHAMWVCEGLERQISPNLIAFHGKRHNTCAAQLSDIRAALEWAMSDTGDADIAARLAAVSCHAFLSMSLLEECGKWAQKGLAFARQCGGDARLEMTLQASLAVSMMFTSASSKDIKQTIYVALALADAADDVHHQLWLLAGLHLLEVRLGDVDAVFAVAQRAQTVGAMSGDEMAKTLSAWMLGMSHHLAGRQDKALLYCNPRSSFAETDFALLIFGFNQRIRALIVRTRALWLAGKTDQAVQLAQAAIDEGLQSASPISHCLALIYATTLFFWIGDLETASRMIDLLLERSDGHQLSHYRKVAACLQGELWVRQGRIELGIARLAEHLIHLRNEQHEVLVWGFNLALVEGYALSGRLDEASRLLDSLLASAGGERFDLPELLRVKSELIFQRNPAAVELSRALLWQAIEIAIEQHSPAWVLRCATSLAQLSIAIGQEIDCRVKKLLLQTMDSVQDKRHTADIRRANAILLGQNDNVEVAPV